MKKAKALQDFNYGSEMVLKGDILEVHVIRVWFYHVRNSLIPAFIVENNPHIFECPYEEKLTSEQWDEKARGYGYFIPRKNEMYYFVRVLTGAIDSLLWMGDMLDVALLRASLAFGTREEAEELSKKLKKERA